MCLCSIQLEWQNWAAKIHCPLQLKFITVILQFLIEEQHYGTAVSRGRNLSSHDPVSPAEGLGLCPWGPSEFQSSGKRNHPGSFLFRNLWLPSSEQLGLDIQTPCEHQGGGEPMGKGLQAHQGPLVWAGTQGEAHSEENLEIPHWLWKIR